MHEFHDLLAAATDRRHERRPVVLELDPDGLAELKDHFRPFAYGNPLTLNTPLDELPVRRGCLLEPGEARVFFAYGNPVTFRWRKTWPTSSSASSAP